MLRFIITLNTEAYRLKSLLTDEYMIWSSFFRAKSSTARDGMKISLPSGKSKVYFYKAISRIHAAKHRIEKNLSLDYFESR